jgi:hypothetical protein
LWFGEFYYVVGVVFVFCFWFCGFLLVVVWFFFFVVFLGFFWGLLVFFVFVSEKDE